MQIGANRRKSAGGFPVSGSTESNKKVSEDIVSSPDIYPHFFKIMPGDETQEQHSDEFDSEVEEEEEISLVEVDATKLTALSPEVISKQVRLLRVVRGFEIITD